MISCTEFIPVYSEAFKFLEETQGRAGLEAFWVRLGRAYLGELRQQAQAKGLRGCFDWWTQVLKEEASDFRTTLDEDAGVLEIHLRCCPSMKRLLTLEHMTPHPQYCEHCNVLYRETLEQLGFDYEVDRSECTQAVCRRYVKRLATT